MHEEAKVMLKLKSIFWISLAPFSFLWEQKFLECDFNFFLSNPNFSQNLFFYSSKLSHLEVDCLRSRDISPSPLKVSYVTVTEP